MFKKFRLLEINRRSHIINQIKKKLIVIKKYIKKVLIIIKKQTKKISIVINFWAFFNPLFILFKPWINFTNIKNQNYA